MIPLALLCLTTFAQAGNWRYLRSNVHAYPKMNNLKSSYAVYTSTGDNHIVIPVNTKVQMAEWNSSFISGKSNGFVLILEYGDNVYFEVDQKRTGRTGAEYYNDILTSPTEIDLSNFSEKDLAGINSGKVTRGMTRQGVRIAFGYPSPHATPYIEGNTWIFWKTRFIKTEITFDEFDKVINIK